MDVRTQEIRKGTLVLAVLAMTGEPVYGYTLVGAMKDAGIDVEQNTLYPLLRRLETQGLLESSWDTGDSRPRKYYQITPAGQEAAVEMGAEWRRLNNVVSELLEKAGL